MPLRSTTPRWGTRALCQAAGEQRAKVAGRGCIACRARTADPAHLTARSRGGCDEADCVVPLCRRCHRAFDDGRLDLLGYLEPGHRAELSHAVLHLGLIGTLERLTAERWCRVGAAGATRRPTGEGQLEGGGA